jgi:hypothetical protein
VCKNDFMLIDGILLSSHQPGLQHVIYRKNTNSKANLPTTMFWHKVLHQYFSANTFNRIIRLRISVFTVLNECTGCTGSMIACLHLVPLHGVHAHALDCISWGWLRQRLVVARWLLAWQSLRGWRLWCRRGCT